MNHNCIEDPDIDMIFLADLRLKLEVNHNSLNLVRDIHFIRDHQM